MRPGPGGRPRTALIRRRRPLRRCPLRRAGARLLSPLPEAAAISAQVAGRRWANTSASGRPSCSSAKAAYSSSRSGLCSSSAKVSTLPPGLDHSSRVSISALGMMWVASVPPAPGSWAGMMGARRRSWWRLPPESGVGVLADASVLKLLRREIDRRSAAQSPIPRRFLSPDRSKISWRSAEGKRAESAIEGQGLCLALASPGDRHARTLPPASFLRFPSPFLTAAAAQPWHRAAPRQRRGGDRLAGGGDDLWVGLRRLRRGLPPDSFRSGQRAASVRSATATGRRIGTAASTLLWSSSGVAWLCGLWPRPIRLFRLRDFAAAVSPGRLGAAGQRSARDGEVRRIPCRRR